VFGAHLSTAGGLHNALLLAQKYACDALQVFTQNQQQWKRRLLTPTEVEQWAAHQRRAGLCCTISHGSYLINLASPDEAMWRRSIGAFAAEVRRCQLLAIPYVVTHPGAHLGSGEERGLARVAAALDEVYASTLANEVMICLEVTAGQGTCVGHRLEHLALIMELTRSKVRVGVCLDTAHLFAGGYDFRGTRYRSLRKQIEKTVGLSSVKVWHMNDSKKGLGSRVDRHEHIGRGMIGLDGFRPIVRDPAFRRVPKIIETPKGIGPRRQEWDRINLDVLRSLV
jgi:deoxyribonuclease-4